VQCDVCGDDAATRFCGDCKKNKYYCDDCFEGPHKKVGPTPLCAYRAPYVFADVFVCAHAVASWRWIPRHASG
jgi:hypothetical protein